LTKAIMNTAAKNAMSLADHQAALILDA